MCVAILFIGSLFESLDVSLAILSGLVILIASNEYGDRTAFLVFLVAGAVSILLLANSAALLFIALGGWYPIVQKKLNMLPPVASRIVKTLIFNAVLILLFVLAYFLTGILEIKWMYFTLILLGNACFVLYDLLLDRFFIWYLLKLRNRLKF